MNSNSRGFFRYGTPPAAWLLAGFASLAVLLPANGQVVVSSLTERGELTWTNAFSSNSTYRIEWAPSCQGYWGGWSGFQTLTNLNSISATGPVVTVSVPMFYRVVWTDPPAPQPLGVWDYSGFRLNGSLVVTGRLTFTAQTPFFSGSWAFQAVPGATNVGPLIGTNSFEGSVEGNFVTLSLGPTNTADDDYILWGEMVHNSFTGEWTRWDFGGGRFTAVRRDGP